MLHHQAQATAPERGVSHVSGGVLRLLVAPLLSTQQYVNDAEQTQT